MDSLGEVLVAKRWLFLSTAGGVVIVAGVVALLLGVLDGPRTHDTADRTVVTPVASPSVTPTPTPRPKASRRHHRVAAHASAVSRRSGTRSSSGGSGLPPADPCAHNHHCKVPPMPPLTPDPDPPQPGPTITPDGP